MLYQIIQDVVNDWNPIEIHPLLTDEYYKEVKQIYNFIVEKQENCSVEEFGQYIYDVFSEHCGHLFEKSHEESELMGTNILFKIQKSR